MAGTLIPPKDGATVRFYRIGHGDCFLIAFDGKKANEPVYVLIDCGYKPGSPAMLSSPTKVDDIVDDIRTATGGQIDVAVITHEHQDHVNGITATRFKDIKIKQIWLAWTEDRDDDLANKLRKDFKDKLYGLPAAREKLSLAGDAERAERIDEFLAFELGGDAEAFRSPNLKALLAADGVGMNKTSMNVFKQKGTVDCIRPHRKIMTIPGAKNVRVYALGPPHKEEDIKDLNPVGSEEFHLARSAGSYFAAAVRGDAGPLSESPFATRFRVPMDEALSDGDFGAFFTKRYGPEPKPAPAPAPAKTASASGAATAAAQKPPESKEIPDNPEWRRIDKEWLYSAEQLALDVNNYTNNASLVLAFELGKGGKVLLFAADAQRGNWASWSKKAWKDGTRKITARDLLARTVLYKVGHHGSHNATLNGSLADKSANLSWMATDPDHAREFTAMITAVRAWAETQAGWDHPLKAIKDALLKKASGRVFQTDTDWKKMKKPADMSDADWKRFTDRVPTRDKLFFDYEITA